MDKTLMDVRNITYIYESSDCGIRDISFYIKPYDMIALLGENGAGKTTIMNSLIGELKIKSGEIYVDDELNYNDLGISTQKLAIDWYLNTDQNVFLKEWLMNEKKDNEEIFKLLDMEDFFNRSVEELSGGQQQRVQIARAMICDPKLYILDEPTTGLDASYSEKIFKYLKKKVEERGSAALISSHDLNLLENYCNKVLYISEGKVKFFGSIEKFLNDYKTYKKYELKIKDYNEESIKEKFENKVIWELNDNIITIYLNENQIISDILEMLKGIKITDIKSFESSLRSIFLEDRE